MARDHHRIDHPKGNEVPDMSDFYDQESPRSFLRAVPDDGAIDPGFQANPYAVPAVDELLDQAIEDIATAKTSPMSAMAKINRDEILDLLEQARDQLPEELRRARWLLKEKAEFLAQSERERDAIIDQGRIEVARIVERQEIVRAAENKARQIVEEARAEARVMKRQMEDFCDQKLATFEVLLDRTAETIARGRHRLLGSAAADVDRTNASTPEKRSSEKFIELDDAPIDAVDLDEWV